MRIAQTRKTGVTRARVPAVVIVSRREVSPTRRAALDVAVLCAIKLAVGAWLLAHGFTHVSDDDYARTVIAERFAHVPRIDPSETSWLPFPFWIEGAAMSVLGRSLEVARAVAVVLGAASVGAPYVAMRSVGAPRAAAFIAVAVAMVLPWNAWLGVATVPEGWAGALVAAAAIAMGNPRAGSWTAAALLVASLSRYEAWPACAVFAGLSAWRVVRRAGAGHAPMDQAARPWRETAWALLAVAGPVAWMAWNAHAHGSAVHFVARVSAFRRAIGAADVPMRDKLIGYPWALVEQTPEAAALGLAGVAGMIGSGVLRARWRWPAIVVAAVMAFLVLGDVRDGAPTHHPARALAGVWWVLVGMGVDAGVAMLGWAARDPSRRALAAGCATAIAAMVWCSSLPSRWVASPGRSESERREAQIARGLDLRARGVSAASITPCSFEHFALLAAWGSPEKAEVGTRTGQPPTPECPTVVER
jgi:hypothetical protein